MTYWNPNLDQWLLQEEPRKRATWIFFRDFADLFLWIHYHFLHLLKLKHSLFNIPNKKIIKVGVSVKYLRSWSHWFLSVWISFAKMKIRGLNRYSTTYFYSQNLPYYHARHILTSNYTNACIILTFVISLPKIDCVSFLPPDRQSARGLTQNAVHIFDHWYYSNSFRICLPQM